MEWKCNTALVIFYAVAVFGQQVSGSGRKNSDGDVVEKTLEFPKVLKRLNEASSISLLKDEYLHFYVPLKSTSERCIDDSKIYLQGLKNFEPWALQMMDSSSKLPSGFMAGYVQDLGNFDECLKVTEAPFSQQYCLVEFRGILPRPWLLHENVFFMDSDSPLLRQNVPRLSFCVPSSCTTADVSAHFTHFVSQWNGTAVTDEYSCTTGESPPPSAFAWFVLLCIIVIIMIVLTSTVYELTSGSMYKNVDDPPPQHKVLTAFSLYKNGKQLLNTSDSAQSLSVLSGIKVFSILWVIVLHHAVLLSMIPSENYIYAFQITSNWSFSWVRGGVHAVDTFLLISGLLLTHGFLKKHESGKTKFNFLLHFFHRFMRISPVNYFAVIAGVTWLSRLSDGPQWKLFSERHSEYCRDNWWTNLLYINNYVDPNRQCLGYTWYLCVDMHLYLLSPLVLFPLMKYRRFATIGLPIILLVSTVIPSINAFVYELQAASPIITRGNRSAWNYSMDYVPTHNRAAPWIVGIALGHILHKLRGKIVDLSKLTVTCGWIVSLILCVGTVYSISYFHQVDSTYNRLESALYFGLNRTLWAIGVAWIIFACETGYGGPVRTFLSWRAFQPLGKLTFSIYMIHFGILFSSIMISRAPAFLDLLIAARDVMGEYLLSACLAVILTFGVEVPFVNIEKLLVN